jgi:hypothetical protein
MGHADVSLDVRCRLAAACGSDLWWRLYPAKSIGLRDSGQLAIAEAIITAAHSSWSSELEHVIAPGDLRAADILFSNHAELAQVEVERSLVDFQAQLRAAQIMRGVIAEGETRPVRLVLAVPDTSTVRERLAPHSDLLGRALPVSSRRIWAALRSGGPIGGDGLLFVRRDRVASRSVADG